MGSFPETYNDPRLGGSVTERLERWSCNLEAPDWFSVVLSSNPETLDHQRVKPSNSLPLPMQVLKLGSR